jgi:UDP-N-acetylenolpyruvoylglucosamine reductase
VDVRIVWCGGDWSELVADTGGHALRGHRQVGGLPGQIGSRSRTG